VNTRFLRLSQRAIIGDISLIFRTKTEEKQIKTKETRYTAKVMKPIGLTINSMFFFQLKITYSRGEHQWDFIQAKGETFCFI